MKGIEMAKDMDKVEAIDLTKMNRAELLQLSKDIDVAIRENEARNRRDAMEKVKEAAAEYGFNLADLVGPGAKMKAPVVAKYRSKDGKETWSGRGRQPAFVREHVEAGGKKEDLLIA